MHYEILSVGYRLSAEEQPVFSKGAKSIWVEFVHHPQTQIAIRQKSTIEAAIFNESRRLNIQPAPGFVETPANDWSPTPRLPGIWTHYLISNLEIESSIFKKATSIRRLQ